MFFLQRGVLVFLLRYIISLLFVLISGPFTEVLDAGRTVRAVMPPKEVWRTIAIVFSVALPCDKWIWGLIALSHDELRAADVNAGGDVVFLIDHFTHYIAALF